MNEQTALEQAIATLQAQRGALGDAVVDAALAALRAPQQAPAPSPAPRSRRAVAVLFIDAVGSTRLASRLDPEDIQAVLDRLLARATATVQRHGGKVLQYTGDGLLAAFGADTAREDDAQRAVRCGLDLAALGREAADAVLAQHRFEGFGLRTGVHHGTVLLGGGVDDAGTIRGMAVNIAARLEQGAPVAGVRISRDVWRLVRGRFDCVALPPLQAKPGEPVLESWIVAGERPPDQQTSARGVDGLSTPLIGRDQELSVLHAAVRAVCDGQPQVVLVTAEPGLGKSRLLDEFERDIDTLAPKARRLRVGARPETQSQVYGLLRDLISRWLHLRDNLPAQQARGAWLDALTPWLGSDRPAARQQAARLGHLLGLDFDEDGAVGRLEGGAAELRRDALGALVNLARVLCAQAPLLILLDDVHWADDNSLDLIEEWLRAVGTAPVLLCALARPALAERRPDWPRVAGAVQRLELTGLAPAQAAALAKALLRRLAIVPDALRQLLAQRAEGNPFYMEELVNMLIDRGGIRIEHEASDGSERWRCESERLAELPVPATLVGVLQARIDALPSAPRRALQHAAVIGIRFWSEPLALLEPGADSALPELLRCGLVRPAPTSTLAGCHEYRFVHPLMQQTAYEGVLRAERQQAHRRCARWLAELFGARASEHWALTAEHCERAGDLSEAAQFHQYAAAAAMDRGAIDAALEATRRGLALAAQVPVPTQLALIEHRITALSSRGDHAAVFALLDEAQGLADAQALGDWQVWAWATRCQICNRTGEHDTAIAAGQAALAAAAARAPASPRVRLETGRTHQALCQVALHRKAFEQAMAHARAAFALAQEDGDAARMQNLHVTLAMASHGAWQLADSNHHYEQAVAMAQSVQRPVALVHALINWAVLRLYTGDIDGALARLEQALPLVREHGLRASEASHWINVALARRWCGEHDAALLASEQALTLGAAAGMRVVVIAAQLERSRVLAALGALEPATAAVEAAAAACDAQALPSWHLSVLVQGAALACAANDGCAAGRLADEACRHPLAAEMELGDRWQLWRALDAAGDPRAEPWLRQSQAQLQSQAARIDEPSLREAFLRQIPEHVELMRQA